MPWKREFSSFAAGLIASVALACAAPADARPGPPLATLVDGRLVLDASPLPPADPAAGVPIRLPDPWTVNRPDARGFAWYLFDWTLDDTPDGIYAIYLPGINTQAQVFVNDTLVGATGDLTGRMPQSWERSQAFAIPFALPRQGVNRVAIRVYVPVAWLAGLDPIVVGPSADIRRRAFTDLVVMTIGPALVSVTIVVLGLFILFLWVRRRDATYALFGASAILWGAHTLLSQLPISPIPEPHWSVWWHGMYMGFACLLSLFCIRFTGVDWRAYRRLVVAFALAVVPVLYVAYALGAFVAAAVSIRAGGIGLVAIALYAVARYAVRMRNTESALLFAAGAVSTAFAVHDWNAANDPYRIREV